MYISILAAAAGEPSRAGPCLDLGSHKCFARTICWRSIVHDEAENHPAGRRAGSWRLLSTPPLIQDQLWLLVSPEHSASSELHWDVLDFFFFSSQHGQFVSKAAGREEAVTCDISPDSSQMCLQVAFLCIAGFCIPAALEWTQALLGNMGTTTKVTFQPASPTHLWSQPVCRRALGWHQIPCGMPPGTLLHQRLALHFLLSVDLQFQLLLPLTCTLLLITRVQYKRADSMASIPPVGPGADDSLPRLRCGDVDHLRPPSLDAHLPSVDDDCLVPWFSPVGGSTAGSVSSSESSSSSEN